MLMTLSNAGNVLGRGLASIAALVLASGCNSLDPHVAPDDGNGRLVIPTDVRPASVAAKPPKPVSGGSLLVTRSGSFAVASDQDNDTIVIVRLSDATVAGMIELSPGDEPGRIVEDASGIVHVALRRGGAIVDIDPATATVLDRRAVCGAPRGLAVTGTDSLTVACADGKLVTLPTAGGAPTRTLTLESDLRDVIATADGGVAVTRFKSAELVRVDAEGNQVRRERPRNVLGTRVVPMEPPEGGGDFFQGSEVVVQPFSPRVAWRSMPGPNGSVVMLHQRAVEEEVKIVEPTMGGSSYGGGGGGFSCGGIVQNAVTVVTAAGVTMNMTFPGPPLAVDATLLPDNRTLVIAHAGPSDIEAPRPFVAFPGEDPGRPQTLEGFGFAPVNTLSVVVLPTEVPGQVPSQNEADPEPGCGSAGTLPLTDPAIAVAYNPVNPLQIVVQTQQPSKLVIFDDASQPFHLPARTVAIADPATTLDTGAQLFHRDSGGGIACASCHPEGAEDGKVWKFSGIGERRTQALDVGLEGTAPFHWDGELAGVGELMSEVFVERMGGINESPERLDGLKRFLFAFEPIARLRDASDEAVGRGQVLFESAETGCTTCHNGARFTNNRSFDVGTRSTAALQVPSLIGIGYRAPFMHDGCAETLTARFDPTCGGGELHGNTAALSSGEVADLVAYLESI
jgi:mono/diheme cytochrome c family protein